MTEITNDNVECALDEIERALELLNVVPVLRFRCRVCGVEVNLEDLNEFAKGARYFPLDPFPVGTRVVERLSGMHGQVIESKVVCISGEHRHRRLVAVKPDSGGRSFCQIEEGFDSCSERFVTLP